MKSDERDGQKVSTLKNHNRKNIASGRSNIKTFDIIDSNGDSFIHGGHELS